MASHETQPLLSPSFSQADSTKTLIESEDERPLQEPTRSIEDDVLPETSTLGRTISWSSAYILVISRVIGSGIFATPGVIVKAVGSVGLSLSLWVLGAVIAACGLAVALEYGCMLPRSGGDKVYLEFTYRKPRYLASTLMAVQAVLLGFTASNCIVFAQYTLYAFDIEATDFLRKSLAVGLLTAITIVHGCFRKTGIAIQNFLGWVKIGLVVFMVFSGLFVVVFKPQGLDGRRSHFPAGKDIWKDTEWSWGTISTSLFKVFYSYAGLNNVSNVLNEVRNPVRTLKSVSIIALITACVLYSLVNIAYFIVIPLDEIKESKELIAALFFEKVFGDTVGKVILPLAVALSGVGNVMVVTFALVSSLAAVRYTVLNFVRPGLIRRSQGKDFCHSQISSHLQSHSMPLLVALSYIIFRRCWSLPFRPQARCIPSSLKSRAIRVKYLRWQHQPVYSGSATLGLTLRGRFEHGTRRWCCASLSALLCSLPHSSHQTIRETQVFGTQLMLWSESACK